MSTKFRYFILNAVFALTCVFHTNPAQAGLFINPDAARHDRLLVGGPFDDGDQPELNPGFLIDHNRITGVGLNRAALITNRHFITANHAPTTNPQFIGSDGVVREFGVTNSSGVRIGNTDIRIYTLSRTVTPADRITPLPIAVTPMGNPAAFDGREVFVMAQNNMAGRNRIDQTLQATLRPPQQASPTWVVGFGFDVDDRAIPDEIGLQGNDSGHPVLIQAGGELALVGANYGISTGNPTNTAYYNNFASALAFYTDEIQDVVGPEFQIRTIDVTAIPEPGSMVFCGLVTCGFVVRPKRPRRRSKSDRRR